MALKRVWIPSPHYSSRGGAGVRLIVIHTAEGARTIESLGSWFQNPSANCSSHVGADDKPGTVGEYVRRPDKAWTQSEFNPVAASLELCGFASWSTDEWRGNHPNMLDNCAKWIAEEAAHYGIPITRLSASQAQGSGRGVCQHVDLGARGGGHHDCGSGFPMDYVLDLARGGAPEQAEQEGDLITSAVAANGNFHVFELDGGWIWYTWQAKDKNNWSGGAEGKGPAGMARFCEAKDVVSISAERASNGNLHVFARKKNGSVVYTWQAADSTNWSGGAPGKSIAALSGFAPEPK
jgi:hypothetical protein